MSEILKDKNSDLIAKRWAKALMSLVCENSEISTQDVIKDLEFISETINSSEELAGVISNPSISTEEKQIVICKLFQEKVSGIVYNFIFALNLRKRLHLIGDIKKAFEKEIDIVKNIKHVCVTSAIELDDNKKEEIKTRIAAKLSSDVELDWNIDEDIVAGLIFNIDETIVDDSVRHKLEDLSKTMIKG